MRLAIIPLRFGNNVLKNKNLLDFYGKPTICYALTAAKKCFTFDDIFITIVSKKIKIALFKVGEYLLKCHTVKSVFCKFN